MSAYDIERAFAAWARSAQFVEYEGEAFYHGTIDGHAVCVDDGTRGDRWFGAHVTVAVDVTERRGVLDRRTAETTPVRAALRAVLAAEQSLVSLRLDDGELALGFTKDTQPEEMARVTARIIDACRFVVPPCGAYR